MRDHAQAVQDAREAVVKKAQEWVLVCNAHWADASWHSRCRAGDELTAAVRHLATLTETEGATDAEQCSACHGEGEVSEHECCGQSTSGECCGNSVEVRVPCLFCAPTPTEARDDA